MLVYGGTPAGIAAALAAASDGDKVLLVEPYSWVGGMLTNGLTHADYRTFEGLTGAFLDFSRRVELHYRDAFGADSPQVKESMRGTQAEPKVNRAIFEQMLAEQPRIKVQRRWALEGVKCSSEAMGDVAGRIRTVEIALFFDESGKRHSVAARFFIDATYEGDLMHAAGAPYRVGREGREEFGESLAPATPDLQLQGYNFRLTMTRDPENRVTPTAPEGYRRKEFIGVLPLLESGKITKLFGKGPPAIFKAQIPSLPNGKFDINDVSHGPVRLSLPGENWGWPDGDGGVAIRAGIADSPRDEPPGPRLRAPPFSRLGVGLPRSAIFAAHMQWNAGLLYFLQNDDAVPKKFRDETREWGWCRDEYPANGHLPEQLYVREARRMIGAHVFSEKDTDHASGDARAVLHRDAIAMGDYGPNCHGTAHDGSRFGGKHTGEFYKRVPPYQVPFGVLLPREIDNLLVPGAVSATHVGFCALRLEPIWMSLGQAAGHAAHLAIAARSTVQRVSVAKLQERLHGAGAATIYVSDVPPGHADFAAVQWWGAAGGLHGLSPAPPEPGQRGKNIIGQYFEAFPGHAAELDKPLDEELVKRWTALAAERQVPIESLPKADGKATRGDWIRAAWTGVAK